MRLRAPPPSPHLVQMAAAVRNCSFKIFAAGLHVGNPFGYPQHDSQPDSQATAAYAREVTQYPAKESLEII